MLLIRDQDFVARLEIEAGGDRAVRLGRVVHQRQLVFLAADEARQLFAIFVKCFVAPARIWIIELECGGSLHIFADRAEHRARRDAQASIVEERSPAGQIELLVANPLPVGFGVTIEQGLVG